MSTYLRTGSMQIAAEDFSSEWTVCSLEMTFGLLVGSHTSPRSCTLNLVLSAGLFMNFATTLLYKLFFHIIIRKSVKEKSK
ncbi:hypothetical protein GDO78_009602 [Eleutherodactylus coqui]|uniref:Uncharacterized protein n=1 Tax=Eleutherodactylus coqui TaxID=57060 RepID=A0A8J6KCI5_ELECQ|nr:hypothetical protein GDO78_009602 [Eleutherodactylus coqui]